MEPVLTGQDGNFGTNEHFVYANCALGLPTVTHHLPVQLLLFQALNRTFGSWRGGVGLGVGLHQLANNPVEGLLGVDSIAMNSVGTCKYRTKQEREQIVDVTLKRRSSSNSVTTEEVSKDARARVSFTCPK